MADKFQLKRKLDNLDELDEAFHGLYKKTPEGYVLDVEPDNELKGRINSFQENNNNLKKEKEDLEKKLAAFEGVDPEKYSEMESKIKEMEASQDPEKEKANEVAVENLVKTRIAKLQEEKDGQISALEERVKIAEADAAKYQNMLQTNHIREQITGIATEKGTVAPGAMVDILNRANGVWYLDEEGNMYAKNEDGNIKYGKDGTEPITPEEWVDDLKSSNPHLFKENTGGGAPGSNNSPTIPRVGGKKYVSINDPVAMGKNAEAIAKGEMEVISP